MRQRVQQLIDAWRDDCISTEEMDELNNILRQSEEARAYFRVESEMHGLIHAAATNLMIDQASSPVRLAGITSVRSEYVPRSTWQAILTTLAGLFIGAFFMSVAWAITSPRMIANVERLLAFANGDFEETIGRIPSGFPRTTGIWSGDHAIVVTSQDMPTPSTETNGQKLLKFIEPGADEGMTESRAISCDVFQLVDLRQLRQHRDNAQELSLELTARFHDGRQHQGIPVTFLCQMFLFSGNPEDMHSAWPSTLEDAVASSKSQYHTNGGSPHESIDLTSRCLVPAEADFAVVQIAARPDLRPAKLESLYVDDVAFSVKSHPTLPTRIVPTK